MAPVSGDLLKIEFVEEKDHVTVLPVDFLYSNDYSEAARAKLQDLRRPLVAKVTNQAIIT